MTSSLNKPAKPPLPSVARQYIQARKNRKGKAIVARLYDWMAAAKLEVEQLEPWHIDQLLEQPFGTVLGKRTRYDYRGELLRYLQHLYQLGQLGFEPSKLRRGKLQRRPLPELAEQFVQSLEPTLSSGTCHAYRTGLRRFYPWLSKHRIALEDIDRQQMSRWLLFLQRWPVTPRTRFYTILQVRAYLRWLYEQGLLRYHPDRLIRRTDLPKLPEYLPRPLSSEADRQLRARLRLSTNRYQRALLLMRNTGLRLGELIGLEYDCLRVDACGNHFLKVPLGKLLNERQVPIDIETRELIESFQANATQGRPWLIESRHGTQTYDEPYRRELKRACQGIDINGRMTTHRLRHTYATTLLNGGMSLVAVMKLLGHRSYHTTLRNAAVTQETIGREYFDALRQLDKRYQKQLHRYDNDEPDPLRMLSDVARWIDKHLAHDQSHPNTARRLIKRIERLKVELQPLVPLT